MKLWDIFLTASSNMFRSKLRTFLTVTAIFVGALTLTLTNGIGAGISNYIDKQLGNLGGKDVLIITASNTAGQSGDGPHKYDPDRHSVASAFGPSQTVITQADLTKIRAQAGIKSVEPQRSVSPDYIQGAGGDKYQLPMSQSDESIHLDLASGHNIINDAKTSQLVLPLDYVKPLGYGSADQAVGKLVTIGITNALGAQTTHQAEIVGVQQKGILGGGDASINKALTTALYEAQTQGLPGSTKDQYQVAFARFDASMSTDKLSALKDSLKKQGYDAITIDDQIGIFKAVINGIIAVLNAFGIIALLAASFGIINTLLMAVQERTKEIGLMKAMGMNSRRIFLLFSLEAVMIGFWGSLIGIAVANVIGAVANQVVSKGFLKDLPGLHLLTFPVSSMLGTMALIMAIAFLAGTLPAWRASRQSPINALRYE